MIATRSLETERLRLEPLNPSHADAMVRYYTENAAHLEPWEPSRPPGFLTAGHWRLHAELVERDGLAERSYSFVAFERANEGVAIAHVNLSNVTRGINQSAILGYSLAERVQGRGLATEAVGAVVTWALEVLDLHRVIATYQPTNERSGKVLRRLGFGIEGFARDYLYINGAWRDSVLTAKVRTVS